VPYGRQTKWDSDGVFRYNGTELYEVNGADLSPSLSWRICDSVSVGAGPIFTTDNSISVSGPPTRPKPHDGRSGRYSVGGNAGITWRMTENQRVALTYRSPFDLKFKAI
jgi:long-subunit fatty acid transport protein